MDILADEKAKRGLGQITKVTLTNGRLAGVVSEALTFGWEALTPGTEFEGCEIVVNETPLILGCGQCGHEFEADSAMYAPCPECGKEIAHNVISGREFLIENIEAEDAPAES